MRGKAAIKSAGGPPAGLKSGGFGGLESGLEYRGWGGTLPEFLPLFDYSFFGRDVHDV
jgi:hypothetical protein